MIGAPSKAAPLPRPPARAVAVGAPPAPAPAEEPVVVHTFERGDILNHSLLEFKSVIDREAAVAAAQSGSSEPPAETFTMTVVKNPKNLASSLMIVPENEPGSWDNLFLAVLDLELDALLAHVMDEVLENFDEVLDEVLREIDRNASGTLELDEVLAHFLARGRDHATIMTAWKGAVEATKHEHKRSTKAASDAVAAASSPASAASPGKSEAPPS